MDEVMEVSLYIFITYVIRASSMFDSRHLYARKHKDI